jgi:hypothetical protein
LARQNKPSFRITVLYGLENKRKGIAPAFGFFDPEDGGDTFLRNVGSPTFITTAVRTTNPARY